MIISASYKTDIPAFYGPWFMNRLKAGYARVKNPYGGPAFTVDLGPGAVEGFVFWTRNPAPFMEALGQIRRLGFPFTVQFTVTGYPRPLEQATITAHEAMDHLAQIRALFGPHAGVWRYDPVVLSSLTPPAWHLENFARLAGKVEGASDEVVLSFAQPYRKTKRNMAQAADDHGFTWQDPEADEKRALLSGLAGLAEAAGLDLTLCGQPELLVAGVRPTACIDAPRLARMAGCPVSAKRKSHREGCACFQSSDLGDYDSCPHGCVYCYAVGSRDKAKERFARHDPEAEFLIPLA
ncbi:MAG: DUF1848 domain-containing protein [Rhodospirillales bacterium]|jgi:hypothetical protein|nr:DUF1848 domain-containing protein [Rhodospirillales bacterium]